jgi:hypothetical protein
MTLEKDKLDQLMLDTAAASDSIQSNVEQLVKECKLQQRRAGRFHKALKALEKKWPNTVTEFRNLHVVDIDDLGEIIQEALYS